MIKFGELYQFPLSEIDFIKLQSGFAQYTMLSVDVNVVDENPQCAFQQRRR